MALTPEQLAQLQQYWKSAQTNPSLAQQPTTIGGLTYGTMGITDTGEGGGNAYTPQTLIQYDPGNIATPGSAYSVIDPSSGNVAYVDRTQNGGSFSDLLKSTVNDLKTPAALFAAMYAGGQGLQALLGSEAVTGGAAAGAGGASGGSLAGDVLSKAALDGTTAFGANSVPGAFNLASLGGGAGNFATGFTDTGTAGGALDSGYAGSGALTGAGGAVFPSAAGTVGGGGGFSLSGLLKNPMLTSGLLNAGGSLIGALAANKAANTQAAAGNRALDLQRDIYNSQVGLEAPFRQAGVDSSQKLAYLLGIGGNNPTLASSAGGYGSMLKPFGMDDFKLDPGIQFQIKQGNQALLNSQAAQNGSLSGAALKALIGFNQDYAGLGYQSAYDRYMNNKQFQLNSLLAPTQIGQAAASGTAANIGATGKNMGDTITGIGNAQAGGTVGTANSLAGGLGAIGNSYLLSQLLGKNNPNMTSAEPSYA
jgi:hypothetical protein